MGWFIWGCVGMIVVGFLWSTATKLRWRKRRTVVVEEDSTSRSRKPADWAHRQQPWIPHTRGPIHTLMMTIWRLVSGQSEVIRSVLSLDKDIRAAEQRHQTHIVQGSLFGHDVVTVWDPDSVKTVLSDDEVYGKLLGLLAMFDDISREAIINVVGDKWTRQRAVLKPAFAADYVRLMGPHFNLVADRLIARLRPAADGCTGISVKPWLHKATLEALGLAGFGYDFQTLGDHSNIQEGFSKYSNMMALFKQPALLVPGVLKLPLPMVKRAKETVRQYTEFLVELIARKRRQQQEQPQFAEQAQDLFDLMLNSHGQLSEEELLHNVNIFFIAGHETSASAMLFAIHALAQHPQVQEKLYEELLAVMGPVPCAVSFEAAAQLRYTECVINEALRMYPPAGGAIRQLQQDTVLSGYQLFKGDWVFVPIYTLHHHDKLWSEPERFWPERFLPENSRHRHPSAFIPFSIGKRSCIGNNFAMREMKILLARLCQVFRFSLDPNTPAPFRVITDLALSLPNDHTLLISKRENIQ